MPRRGPSGPLRRDARAIDPDLFHTFKASPADAQAIGPASIHYWARYNWRLTPLKSAPWKENRLKLWLEVEATEVYGKLPLPERKVFFSWWRWKRSIPRRARRMHDGNVFFTDELGRIRVFWA